MTIVTPAPAYDIPCTKCKWTDFYPANKCPRCKSEVLASTIPGEGMVVTFTAIRYPPQGFEKLAPYVVAIVDLHNGQRVMGRVSNPPNEVKVGSNVWLISSKAGQLEFSVST